ncbi:arylesterase [Oceanobacter mangrovi]|uniref:arylesterase n=1 Tax=Oceanobacter mangrovi TaxID=2862510 RepID=UPI001FE9E8B0|nr:arylesterase [Oceanobacter mangrovi]
MKAFQSLFLLIAVTATSLLATPAWAADGRPLILVVGDSISAGFGVPVQQGWVTLFEKDLQQHVPAARVVNASISGDTTQGGLARLPALLQQYQPDLLMIELGGNDGLRGMPLQLIRKNLSQMTAMAENEGVMVMLLGMQIPPNYGATYTDGFAALYSDLADQQDTLLLPFLLQDVATKPELMQADGIHPTAAAQPIMAAAVMAELQVWLESLE